MVEQSGEPLLLSFLCCFPHTVQPLGHALPALCRVHVRLSDVLPRLCPSLPSLRGRLPSLVRLVHRYYGTVRLLRHVHVRRAACGLRGPALIVRPRRAGDLPVLVHVVSQRARVLRLRRTEQPLAISAAAVLPSSYSEWSRHPDLRAFRSSIAPPTDASIYASRNTSRCPPQDSRSGWIRYFLSCRALASPTTCRFSPAHSDLPVTRQVGRSGLAQGPHFLRSAGRSLGVAAHIDSPPSVWRERIPVPKRGSGAHARRRHR